MDSSIRFHADSFPFPMHSVLVWQRGRILQEEYFPPYDSTSLHRMFSVTKSFAALAAGGLIAEGKLSLKDRITDFFPEYLPEAPHSYLIEMTIEDMLSMRTCYPSTTYKIDMKRNWVESFFISPPDHRPGRIFKYDTSSAHTLAALVKKISGKGLLDYLRCLYLDRIGFSARAHILADPFGSEMGGSGLVASPRDLLGLAKLLLSFYKDSWREEYGSLLISEKEGRDPAFWDRYASFVQNAMRFKVSTLHEGKTLDECQGYGWQFWMIRGGISMYGMGGQYVLFYPDLDLIIITTADTQAIQGGTQYILEEAWRLCLAFCRKEGKAPRPVLCRDLTCEENESALFVPLLRKLTGTFALAPNRQGFRICRILEDALCLEGPSHTFVFPLRKEGFASVTDPCYHQKLFVRSSPLKDGSLYLYVQILDDYTGNIRMVLKPAGDTLTIYMHKIEESLFGEFNGFLEGTRI